MTAKSSAFMSSAQNDKILIKNQFHLLNSYEQPNETAGDWKVLNEQLDTHIKLNIYSKEKHFTNFHTVIVIVNSIG